MHSQNLMVAGAARGRADLTQEWLTKVAIFFLPFSTALTVNLGFPLKLSEVLFLLSAAMALLPGRLPIRLDETVRHALILFAVLALGIVYNTLFDTTRTLQEIRGARFSPLVDAITKLIYFGFDLVAYLVVNGVARRKGTAILRWWFAGAIVSGLYLWYSAVSSLVGLEPVLLPGIERHQTINIGEFFLSRSGTFEEGNFGGLYYLLSLALALRQRSMLLTMFLASCLLLTFSTLAVLAGTFIGVVSLFSRSQFRPIRKIVLARAAVIVISPLVLVASYFLILDKFSGAALSSGYIRYVEFQVAAELFTTHPLFGVGLSQYGFFANLMLPPEYFGIERAAKPIPNNVYMELLSETGVIGFLITMVLLVRHYLRLRRRAEPILANGTLTIFFCFLAFPTFSFLYVWCWLAVTSGFSNKYSSCSKDFKKFSQTATAPVL